MHCDLATTPAELPLVLESRQIVLADWLGDVLPKEPNKRSPAIMVEDASSSLPPEPALLSIHWLSTAGPAPHEKMEAFRIARTGVVQRLSSKQHAS